MSLSFVLRLLPTATADHLSGEVVDVVSGRSAHFRGVEELVAFLAPYLVPQPGRAPDDDLITAHLPSAPSSSEESLR